MPKKINGKYIKEIFQTDSDYTEWFGYYNYDVFSRDGKKMLCNRATFEGRAITAEDSVELGWYNLDNGDWNSIGTTNSFNWQQGAMLQWLPGEENEGKVVYNKAIDNHFKTIIFDINTREERSVDFPVYCVTPDGKYSISLNYERSYWCRAYHYQSVVNGAYDVDIAEDDGIFKVDLSSGKVERILTIQEIVAVDADENFKEAKHWLEHVMLNREGSKIAFLHRFTYGVGYVTRLCVCDIDGKNLQVISGWRSYLWSHLGWITKDSFAIYSVKSNALMASYAAQMQNRNTSGYKRKKSLKAWLFGFAKKITPKFIKQLFQQSENGYKIYAKKSGFYVEADWYKQKVFQIDGHPSFTADGKYMITDSYPNKKGYQQLIIYNTQTKKHVMLAEFLAPLKGNPASCDLHPKFCANEKMLAVDSAFSGKHKMLAFELDWANIKGAIG